MWSAAMDILLVPGVHYDGIDLYQTLTRTRRQTILWETEQLIFFKHGKHYFKKKIAFQNKLEYTFVRLKICVYCNTVIILFSRGSSILFTFEFSLIFSFSFNFPLLFLFDVLNILQS